MRRLRHEIMESDRYYPVITISHNFVPANSSLELTVKRFVHVIVCVSSLCWLSSIKVPHVAGGGLNLTPAVKTDGAIEM